MATSSSPLSGPLGMGTWHMMPGANRVVIDHLTSFKLIGVSLKSLPKVFGAWKILHFLKELRLNS